MRRATPRPNAPERLTTERLALSRPEAGDLDELAAMLADERVGPWLGGTLAHDQAAAALHRHAANWDAHGFGLWIVRDAASGDFLGRGGLQMTVVGGRAEVEVGWAIVHDRWGEGLATELGRAALRVAHDELGITGVVSFTLSDNHPSRRVMEKIGLILERELEHAGLPHVLYREP